MTESLPPLCTTDIAILAESNADLSPIPPHLSNWAFALRIAKARPDSQLAAVVVGGLDNIAEAARCSGDAVRAVCADYLRLQVTGTLAKEAEAPKEQPSTLQSSLAPPVSRNLRSRRSAPPCGY